MIYLTLFTIAALTGLVIFLLSRFKKEGRGAGGRFFAQGRDAGFSFKETGFLRQLALKCRLPDPNALYSSRRHLDTCIRFLVREMQMSAGGDTPEKTAGAAAQEFLSKLYDLRQNIEIEKSRNEGGIADSQGIDEGQPLRILVKGTGVFRSEVLKNSEEYLTISRPVSIKAAVGFSWTGLKITVHFWREDDAAYVFDSEVEEEAVSRGVASLVISHSDSLFRTQKRKSLRLKIHKTAFLYLMGPGEPPARIEVVPGLKCFLEDISDTGCAITVGGKATPGLHIKVQFALDNTPVCMSGTVRSVDIMENGNYSVLHVEADTLPAGTRNRILGAVFGILPFQVVDNEESKAV